MKVAYNFRLGYIPCSSKKMESVLGRRSRSRTRPWPIQHEKYFMNTTTASVYCSDREYRSTSSSKISVHGQINQGAVLGWWFILRDEY